MSAYPPRTPPAEQYVQGFIHFVPEVSRGGYAAAHYYQPGWPVKNPRNESPPSGMEMSFSDKAVRRRFMVKVYSMLSLQLIVLFGSCLAIRTVPHVEEFVRAHPELILIGFVFQFTLLLLMCCNPNMIRSHPLNLFILTIFTLSNTLSISAVSVIYRTDTLLYTIGATLMVFMVLTLFAAQTCIDFTVCGGIMLTLTFLLLLLGLVAIYVHQDTLLLVYHGIGAFLFCAYIVYDTQMIMGGHRYALSPEDYIMATIMLYMDVVNVFLNMLGIINYNG
ncbi:Hypothetical predicted protein [Cloeon dipterum]|uniref:Protein lifeguard 1 n=1 Tax=Cloeon dipterum TaxID=197152 RepID=A0A8S1CFB2_9INSE|nr:Hypothetical predicted protein [Cloeon dipterum]